MNVKAGSNKLKQFDIMKDGLPREISPFQRAEAFKDMVRKAQKYTMIKNRSNTLDKYQLSKLYQIRDGIKSPRVPDKNKLKAGMKKHSVALSPSTLDQKILVQPHQVTMPKNQRKDMPG